MANDLSAQLQARFNQAPEKEDKRQDTFGAVAELIKNCLLYTSDAADDIL